MSLNKQTHDEPTRLLLGSLWVHHVLVSIFLGRGKWCCRYPGGFQRRGGEACLWHTILLARSSVLYLLFREAGKGVVSPFRTAHLYPPKTAAKNCEGMSRV